MHATDKTHAGCALLLSSDTCDVAQPGFSLPCRTPTMLSRGTGELCARRKRKRRGGSVHLRKCLHGAALLVVLLLSAPCQLTCLFCTAGRVTASNSVVGLLLACLALLLPAAAACRDSPPLLPESKLHAAGRTLQGVSDTRRQVVVSPDGRGRQPDRHGLQAFTGGGGGMRCRVAPPPAHGAEGYACL